MTTIIRILIITLVTTFSSINAQNFHGVATYKTQTKLDIKLDSTNTSVSKDMQAQMMEMMKKQFQKTYNLAFNKEASTYKEEVTIEKPQVGGGNLQFQIIGSGGGSDILYKNIKQKRYSDQKDTMGKIFLVKDSIKPIEWKLESESKFIGEYQCYKATYTKRVKNFKKISYSRSSKSEKVKEKDKEEQKSEMKDRVVEAWYTPQIPVNNGPAMYQGLPGLILEVHDGSLTVVCSKIVLNPEEKVEIKEPEKGKEVNSKTYKEIIEKKSKEMMERYSPRNGRKGEHIEIRIGG